MKYDATFDFGPCYNVFTKDYLPVLGMWQEPSDKERLSVSSATTGEPLPCYMPESGAVILRGLSLGKDHDILFHCGFRDDVPALLFQEDFDVLSILVFLNNQNDFPLCRLVSTEDQDWHRVEWSLAWLSETILGKTLYACTQYLNVLAFNPQIIPIASKEDFFDAGWFDPVIDLIEELKYRTRKSRISPHDHIVLMEPLAFEHKVSGVIDNTAPENNSWRIDVTDLPLSIAIYDKVEHRKLEPVTSFLDLHREAFPQLMPVFERYRQLYSLFNALKILRDSGYEMPSEMKENYQSVYQFFLTETGNEQEVKICRLLSQLKPQT